MLKTWDERSTALMALVCGISAGIGGLTANIFLPHLVESATVHGVLGALFAGGSVLLGNILFSIIDQCFI